MINRIYIFIIAFLIILFDQFSKCIVSSKLLVGERYLLVNNIVSLYKIYNTGAAFSILQNSTFLLILFSIVVIIMVSIYFVRNNNQVSYLKAIGWGFILGGTVGNLIDRIRLGFVVDFIRLDFVNFPIFNVADLFINLGAIIILFYLLLKSPEKIG